MVGTYAKKDDALSIMPAPAVDDKSRYCIPFIVSQLQAHNVKHAKEETRPPLFLGLNGVQGAGKSTLASTLASTLRQPPHSLPTAVLSIDDLYLPHSALKALAKTHPANPLLQQRGQPSTHDISLGLAVFSSLRASLPTKLPAFDKGAYAGEGDRVTEASWETVNSEKSENIKLVIFEGWCVGFKTLGTEKVTKVWEAAVDDRVKKGSAYIGRLGWMKLEDVLFVDRALEQYEALTNQLDALIHIDARDTRYVYEWRLSQEYALRSQRGTGMTDKQVREFVDGYYPSYELYLDPLRAGLFKETGKHLRLIVKEDRQVDQVVMLGVD